MFESKHGKIIGDSIVCTYDTDILGSNKDRFISLLRFHKLPYKYFNGKNTDKLFIGVILSTKRDKKAFKRFVRKNKHFIGLTKSEKSELKQIRKGYYLSKKYLDKEPTSSEYGVYEPINQYTDYWFSKNCSDWEKLPKGVKYTKKTFEEVFGVSENTPNKVYKSQIDQILEYLCKFISNSTFKGNSYDIYKKMVDLNKEKIIKHMDYLKNNPYNDVNEFLECIIRYGATHTENQDFWREVHKELQLSKKLTFRG